MKVFSKVATATALVLGLNGQAFAYSTLFTPSLAAVTNAQYVCTVTNASKRPIRGEISLFDLDGTLQEGPVPFSLNPNESDFVPNSTIKLPVMCAITVKGKKQDVRGALFVQDLVTHNTISAVAAK